MVLNIFNIFFLSVEFSTISFLITQNLYIWDPSILLMALLWLRPHHLEPFITGVTNHCPRWNGSIISLKYELPIGYVSTQLGTHFFWNKGWYLFYFLLIFNKEICDQGTIKWEKKDEEYVEKGVIEEIYIKATRECM